MMHISIYEYSCVSARSYQISLPKIDSENERFATNKFHSSVKSASSLGGTSHHDADEVGAFRDCS